MTRRNLIRGLQVVFGTLLGLAAVFLWMARSHSPSDEASVAASYFLQSPIPVSPFSLRNQEGVQVSSKDFSGKVRVVFFGYTFCPDICPLTLSHLSQAFRIMGENGDRVQVFLITVDPDRDTPERLEAYLRNFHPSFMGLTGTEDEIREVADSFGAYFSRSGEGENYTIDHTARTFVLDGTGRIVLTFPITATPEEMAGDLTRLLEEEIG